MFILSQLDQTDDSDLNNTAVTQVQKIAFDTTATIACRWLQVAIETAVRIFDLSEKKTKVRI